MVLDNYEESQILQEKGIKNRTVKNCLNILILSMVKNNPMCGYDIIGAIHDKFHVLLSPGTVYPLLYSLEKKELVKKKEIGTKKIYFINEETKDTSERIFDEFIKTNNSMIQFIDLKRKK